MAGAQGRLKAKKTLTASQRLAIVKDKLRTQSAFWNHLDTIVAASPSRMWLWIISSIVVDNAHIFQGRVSTVLLKGMFPACRSDCQQTEQGSQPRTRWRFDLPQCSSIRIEWSKKNNFSRNVVTFSWRVCGGVKETFLYRGNPPYSFHFRPAFGQQAQL